MWGRTVQDSKRETFLYPYFFLRRAEMKTLAFFVHIWGGGYYAHLHECVFCMRGRCRLIKSEFKSPLSLPHTTPEPPGKKRAAGEKYPISDGT